MKKITGLLLALSVIMLSACTDAAQSSLMSYGSSARVTCHSGGKVIYDGCSTGRVASNEHSDGYGFRDKETGRYVDVSGECFIDYDAPCPATFVRPSVSAGQP